MGTLTVNQNKLQKRLRRLAGEAVASGGRHGDNVGPMLLGGLVLLGYAISGWALGLFRGWLASGWRCRRPRKHCRSPCICPSRAK